MVYYYTVDFAAENTDGDKLYEVKGWSEDNEYKYFRTFKTTLSESRIRTKVLEEILEESELGFAPPIDSQVISGQLMYSLVFQGPFPEIPEPKIEQQPAAAVEMDKAAEGLKTDMKVINEELSTPTVPIPDPKDYFLTKEEIMIKILMMGGIPVPGVPLTTAGMDEETAYESVYGELQYDENDELLYPGVINEEKRKIKESHPMNEFIDKSKKEVADAVEQIKVKTGEIAEASVQLGIEVAAASVTIASSAVIMPLGAGVPTGFSAVLSIFSSLQAYQTKINQVIPYLKPLSLLSILIPAASVAVIMGPITIAITTIRTTIATVKPIIKAVKAIKSILGSPPGVELPDGSGTPAEPIELQVNASQYQISPGQLSILDVSASKGKWDYSYSWTADNDSTFYSTDKKVTVEPLLTTTYTIEVSDPGGNKSSESITILVI